MLKLWHSHHPGGRAGERPPQIIFRVSLLELHLYNNYNIILTYTYFPPVSLDQGPAEEAFVSHSLGTSGVASDLSPYSPREDLTQQTQPQSHAKFNHHDSHNGYYNRKHNCTVTPINTKASIPVPQKPLKSAISGTLSSDLFSARVPYARVVMNRD